MPKITKILFQRKYLHNHAMSRTGKPIQMKDTPDLMTHINNTLSSSGLEQITPACPYLLSQGGGLGMARGDCCIIPEQQVMHGSTHDLTAADHHGSFPCHLHTCTTESQERAEQRSLCSLGHTNTNSSGGPVSLSLALVLEDIILSLLRVVGNCSWEGGRKDHFNLVLLLSKAAEMKCGISAEVVKQSLAMCVISTLIEDYCTHE